jgi:hypothetical protein
VKKDIRVIRMIAAVSSMFFGSLWIAFTISNEVAPPEPEIARILRHACLVLFIVAAIWGLYLYSVFRRETQRIHQNDTEPAEDAQRNGR